MVWIWGAILESAAEVNDGGRYDIDIGEIAYFLRADDADVSAVVDALTANGRVASGCVVKWCDRQFESDRSAPRQAAYRKRKRSQDGDNDVPETLAPEGFFAPARWRLPRNEWEPLRNFVFARDDYTCRYCGERGGKLECDHIIPVSRRGDDSPDNLATACFACNRSKRDKLLSEWRR